MKAQISIDFLIALTLITITAVNLISLGLSQMKDAETFDTSSKLKVFAIDVRDTVAKVYSSGRGFKIRKSWPFNLGPGDNITIALQTPGMLNITAFIGGEKYIVIEKLQVPITQNTSVILQINSPDFWIENDGGSIRVEK